MSRPIIKVEQGELQGAERITAKGNKYFNFKGIPFAEPPVGPLRFKAPVPIESWSGNKDASKEGNKSLQMSFEHPGEMIGNEDCLYLNIYTPSLPNGDGNGPYPVMVYIHGGGFIYGSGDEEEFGAEFFLDKNTIIVSINYRLSVFGFLCLDTPDVPGNAGLKDQNLALEWIKNNIKNFNGDDNNITIFGISAGSASVEYQLISPLSRGLFHKAIMESGSVLNPWSRNIKPRHLVEVMSKGLEIEYNDPEILLEQLQKMDAQDILKASLLAQDDEALAFGTLFGFAPVVEKSFEDVKGFLTTEPLELLKSGNFMQIPTIIGLCKNEGSMFPFFYGEARVQKIRNRQYADYMKAYVVKDENAVNEQLTTLYKSSGADEKRQIHDFLSDLMFVAGLCRSLKYRAKYNEVAYGFLFSFAGNLRYELPMMDIDYSDPSHGGEMPYLTKFIQATSEDKATPRDLLMRDQMVEMWTSFAKTGNPVGEGSSIPVKWLPATEKEFNILDINDDLNMIPYPWSDRMNIWDNFYP